MDSKVFTIIVGNGINSTPKISKGLGIKIYPNPVQEILQIDIGNNQNVGIEILTITGKTMSVTNNLYSNTTISLTNLPAGVYLVKVTIKEGAEFKKIIKN